MSTVQIESILKDWALWPSLCSKTPSIEHVSPLVDGLTNSNWLLGIETDKESGDSQQYVIRINATNNLALKLNRQAEWDMHQSISHYNICPAYLYRDPQDIYWIRPFLKTHTLDSALKNNPGVITQEFLKKIASQLRTIHSVPISNSWPSINYADLIEHYWQQITPKQNKINVELAQDLQNVRAQLDLTLQCEEYSPCLCHMDPNPSNWILDNEKLHLIDWEYAAVGNKAWDLAVFADTCNLTPEQIEFFLKFYQGISTEQFNLASKQMQYLSLLWFYVQNHLTDAALLNKLIKLQGR